jgi:large subunit ribosomal protein L25
VRAAVSAITGRTPGIVYGGVGEPQLIELDHNALWHASRRKPSTHHPGHGAQWQGTSKVLLRDVQMHPYKQLILHIDFQRVDANTKLHMKVPLHFSGQEESPAVKLDHCLINHVVNEIDISCLPADLPEFIAVDLTGLKKGHILALSDIKLPNGVKAVTKGKKTRVLCRSLRRLRKHRPRLLRRRQLQRQPPLARAPGQGRTAAKHLLPRSNQIKHLISAQANNGPPRWAVVVWIVIQNRLPFTAISPLLFMIKLFVGLGNPGRNTTRPATMQGSGGSILWHANSR